jgi:hypothetical protein
MCMQQRNALDEPPELAPDVAAVPAAVAELAPGSADEPVPQEDAVDLFGESPPEHGWPGLGLVTGLYMGGAFALVQTVLLLMEFGDEAFWQDVVAMTLTGVFPAALLLWTARMIQQFKLAGWGVALAILGFGLFTGLRVLSGAVDALAIFFGLVGAGVSILWICYLLAHRPEFD